MKRNEIVEVFSDIMYESEQKSICNFVTSKSNDELFDILENIHDRPLSKVQLDQLLILHQQKNVSEDFFRYYWLTMPSDHIYEVDPPKKFTLSEGLSNITSVYQLKWGFTRIFTDCLLIFGNIQRGYEILSRMNFSELQSLFERHKINTEQIRQRGKTLAFEEIDKEDRYLISEMACKTLATPEDKEEFIEFVVDSYKRAVSLGKKNIRFKDILEGKYRSNVAQSRQESIFATDENLNSVVHSENEVVKIATDLAERFLAAHKKALKNTSRYLSLCNDLDVYVATSMRTKQHFLEMANFCESVFARLKAEGIVLRYFDPTISAADTHEDKGLIECLMVKSARILVYSSGDRDSYGKDAEAAMALSMGKPTIFYCPDENKRAKFFKEVHPLSRLVNFQTGVASGVIVCQSDAEVATILSRLVHNKMKYQLLQKQNLPGFYLLKERTTQSVVRVQTNNQLLSTAFWNHYV